MILAFVKSEYARFAIFDRQDALPGLKNSIASRAIETTGDFCLNTIRFVLLGFSTLAILIGFSTLFVVVYFYNCFL